ncbi:MAG: hypothetical protein HFJ65_02285 [Eggerthellaceae bacterium]|nr:hypothetical protein [Eggerthellaceae bacterium]
MNEHVARMRLARAATVLVGIAFAVSCILLVGGGPVEAEAGADAQASLSAQDIVDQVAASGSLDGLMADSGYLALADGLPEWFTDEVMDARLIDQAYGAEDWSIVYLSVSKQALGESGGVLGAFEEKGWIVMKDEEHGMASMVKEGGSCNWMTVSVAEAASAWDVVLRIQQASQGREGIDGS